MKKPTAQDKAEFKKMLGLSGQKKDRLEKAFGKKKISSMTDISDAIRNFKRSGR